MVRVAALSAGRRLDSLRDRAQASAPVVVSAREPDLLSPSIRIERSMCERVGSPVSDSRGEIDPDLQLRSHN
ncbi:hypothetical protein AB4084_33995, partial [Lysobacter sp. 2RAB21]